MKRALLALCTLAFAAAPVLAGPVYLPGAINETDGAYVRATELWVTNPDTAIQGFVVRYIAATANGTVRTAGDETGPYYIAPGETKRYTNLVPAGFRGMLELDGALLLQFSGTLTVRNQNGTKVAEPDIPVLDQRALFVAGSSVALQGWERAGSTVTTNLGIVNLSHSVASCSVTVRQKDGLLVVQNVPITLQPLTSVQFDDALAILGISNAAEGGRSQVACNQGFFTYLSTYNDQTGEVEFIEAAKTLAGSTLTEPVGTAPGPEPGPGLNFTLPGEFHVSSFNSPQLAHNFDVPGTQTFRRLIVDFDVVKGTNGAGNGNFNYVFYEMFVVKKGSSWANDLLFFSGFKEPTGKLWNETNAGGFWDPDHGHFGLQATGNCRFPTGARFHLHAVYDTIAGRLSIELSQNGQTQCEIGSNIGIEEIVTSRIFFQTGGVLQEGPEGWTPGWRYSNLVLQLR